MQKFWGTAPPPRAREAKSIFSTFYSFLPLSKTMQVGRLGTLGVNECVNLHSTFLKPKVTLQFWEKKHLEIVTKQTNKQAEVFQVVLLWSDFNLDNQSRWYGPRSPQCDLDLQILVY